MTRPDHDQFRALWKTDAGIRAPLNLPGGTGSPIRAFAWLPEA